MSKSINLNCECVHNVHCWNAKSINHETFIHLLMKDELWLNLERRPEHIDNLAKSIIE
jgi:hypothetical protein